MLLFHVKTNAMTYDREDNCQRTITVLLNDLGIKHGNQEKLDYFVAFECGKPKFIFFDSHDCCFGFFMH